MPILHETDDSPSGPRGRQGRAIPAFDWLVSVSTADEMRLALEFPIDILDFKDPTTGPLAPSSPELWQMAAEEMGHADRVSSGVRLSAALGETQQALEVARQVPKSFAFAKAGPSGCLRADDLQRLWQKIADRLADPIELVAVAYADHETARTLPPEDVFELAAKSGMKRVLVDTYSKRGESSVDILGRDRIESLTQIATQWDLWWALAGSIKLSTVTSLVGDELPIDCFAARGDLCKTDRTSGLSLVRMRTWSSTIARLSNRR